MSTSTKLLLAFAVVFSLLMIYLRYIATISQEQARQLVSEGALLLDVRSPQEFAAGHIEGAQNIPVAELAERTGELGSDKQKPIVLYCQSGTRSAYAKGILGKLGFAKVYNLGPMSRWY